ncbi:MAG: hypothetical protein ACR2GU_10785 [Rubrobacteraceae bacterium]
MVAAILGIVGTVKGSRGLGIAAFVGFVIGLILSAILLSFVNQQ